MEVMTPDQPRWQEFLNLLDVEMPEQMKSCHHDFRHTRKVLSEIGTGKHFDVEATLAYLREHGAHCDCEILLNLADDDDDDDAPPLTH